MTRKTGEGWSELRHWRTLGWLFAETRIFTAAVIRLLDEEAFRAAHGWIYLLHVIDKAERADLTRRQIAMLRATVEEELP